MIASLINKTRAQFVAAILATLAVVVAPCNVAAQAIGSFTDPRDNTTYRTVRIGTQTWMAQNLNYQTKDSWCYDNANSNCEKYGRLYTWDAAMDGASGTNENPSGVQGVCPPGWHLPSAAEWDVLIVHIDPAHIPGGENTTGRLLKSKTVWPYINNEYATLGKINTDDYGFSALPGGWRNEGKFYVAGYNGIWWTSVCMGIMGNPRAAIQFQMAFYSDALIVGPFMKADAASVRCVQD